MGKSCGEGSSIINDPLPTIDATNHQAMTMDFPVTKSPRSCTKTRLFPLSNGISSVNTMMVLAEPEVYNPGGT